MTAEGGAVILVAKAGLGLLLVLLPSLIFLF